MTDIDEPMMPVAMPAAAPVAMAAPVDEFDGMFDELDEATAIFKYETDPPVSASEQFLSLKETAPDHYLYLVGQARKGLRREVPITSKMLLTQKQVMLMLEPLIL